MNAADILADFHAAVGEKLDEFYKNLQMDADSPELRAVRAKHMERYPKSLYSPKKK